MTFDVFFRYVILPAMLAAGSVALAFSVYQLIKDLIADQAGGHRWR